MKKLFISCFAALLAVLTPVPSLGFYSDVCVVKAADKVETGTVDGYHYELWNQNNTGSADIQIGSDGEFSCSWSDVENCVFSMSRNFGSIWRYNDFGSSIYKSYDVDYKPMGNSYMCIHGWTEAPNIEYYIVEAWGNQRPPGQARSLGTFTSDGNEYDIYHLIRVNQPSIHGTETFDQYWSVRKTNPAQVNVITNLKGTVTVADHFKAWEKAGLRTGKLYDMGLNIEAFSSSGSASVKNRRPVFNVTTPAQSTSTDTPSAPDEDIPAVSVTSDPGSSRDISDTSTDSLKNAFAGFFKVGTFATAHHLNNDSDSIRKHFNSITPENELKPESIINQSACQQYGNNINTQVSFGSGAKQIMQFCSDNGISMRGNTFVWYSQTPDWFFRENFKSNGAYVSKDIMDKRLESFIKNTFDAIAQQYPKLDLYAYDVCSELFVNDGGGLRPAENSNWVRVYGDDSFVEKSFTYARKYAPSGCRLYLSDYNEYMPEKTDDIYNMAMKLKSMGVIDGISMQSYLDVSYPSASVYEKAMKKFISTGLDVQVTELNISATSESRSAQASLYKDIFRFCAENADHVPSLTLWRPSESGWELRNPFDSCLFDMNYRGNESYKAVMEYAKTLESTAPVTTPALTSPPVTASPAVTTQTIPTDLKGDTDCNGSVTAGDIVKMMQMMVGKITLSAQGQKNADINKDGEVSVIDLILLKNMLLS